MDERKGQRHVLPKTQTTTITTMMAIIPPCDSLIPPESFPLAPASESPDPASPTSPAIGPVTKTC